MTEHRWVWAGIAVRDEEGNMLMLQMNDPQGQVESSLEVEVVRGRTPNTREYIPGRTLLRVHLRGYAHEWTPGTAQTRKATSINGRTQEIESTLAPTPPGELGS